MKRTHTKTNTHAVWFINENHEASDGIYRNMSVCSKKAICRNNKDVETHTDALLRTWHGSNGKMRVLCE